MSVTVASLLITHNRLRSGSAEFKLCVHFLQARSQRVNLLLLACGICFQFLNSLVLFQKLVEQHRVYRFVANAHNLSFLVASDKLRIHFLYFLRNQAELWNLVRIELFLVTEGHRLECKDRFAGLIHWLNCFLESRRGNNRAELVVGTDDYSYSTWNSCTADADNKGGVLRSSRTDADSPRFTRHTRRANIYVKVPGGKICSGIHA